MNPNEIHDAQESESLALGAALLGVTLPAATPARPKANRLTAAQRDRLANWMRGQPHDDIAAEQSHRLADIASEALGFDVTSTNAEFTRREVLGIRRPARVKPAVQEHFCVSAASMAQLRADVRELADALAFLLPSNGNVREIAERAT